MRLVPPVALALSLAACAPGDGARDDAPDASAAAAAPAAGDTLFSVLRDVRMGAGCREGAVVGDSDAVEQAPCATVELQFPDSVRAAVPALADSVRAFVRRTAFVLPFDSVPAASGEAAATAFLAAYDAAWRETPAAWQLWFMERDVAVACNTPRIVGLRATGAEHTGGAHPMSWARLATFDARTGRRLDATALFVPESLPALTAAAEREFRRRREIPAGQSLADAGFTGFANGRFALPSELLACPDSVAFHFDPYEVGPSALGPSDFALPLDAVRPYLRADTPLR